MLYQIPELLKYLELTHGFSTKEAGNMSFRWDETGQVTQNRQRFFEQLGAAPTHIVTAELEHGDNIIRVGKKDAHHGVSDSNYHLKADGLITNEPGLLLFHVVADCLSLLFYDPKHRAVGLVHAGRKNAEIGIARKAVERLRVEFGSRPTDLVVGFGPAIHACCYALPNPEQKSMPAWQPFTTDDEGDLTHIDLVGFYVHRLKETGLTRQHIFVSPECTAHSGKFFSHYRSLRKNETEARLATLIGLKAN